MGSTTLLETRRVRVLQAMVEFGTPCTHQRSVDLLVFQQPLPPFPSRALRIALSRELIASGIADDHPRLRALSPKRPLCARTVGGSNRLFQVHNGIHSLISFLNLCSWIGWSFLRTYVLPPPFYEHALHVIIQSHGCLLTSRLGLVSPVAIMIIMASMDLPFLI